MFKIIWFFMKNEQKDKWLNGANRWIDDVLIDIVVDMGPYSQILFLERESDKINNRMLKQTVKMIINEKMNGYLYPEKLNQEKIEKERIEREKKYIPKEKFIDYL